MVMVKANRNASSQSHGWSSLILTATVSLLIGVWIGSVSKESFSSITVEHQEPVVRSSLAPPPQEQAQAPSNTERQPCDCDLSSDLLHLSTPKYDYPNQLVGGPMQADEMLMLFALIRSSSVTRVLEIGGYHGDSAFNWLQALRCKDGEHNSTHVYTVDINPVAQQQHAIPHTTIQKDASLLTLEDLHNEPIDFLLLDCHDFVASQHILQTLVFSPDKPLLSKFGYIVLHDTGLHRFRPVHLLVKQITTASKLVMHQPVERLLVDWIPMIDCSFQRVSFHDDWRERGYRHGVTIMQRKMNVDIEECKDFAEGAPKGDKNFFGHTFGWTKKDCQDIYNFAEKQRETCPI